MADNDDHPLEVHLEAEVKRYFPTLTNFWVGANDDDCLTMTFDLGDRTLEYWQTEDNMGGSDEDYFIFVNVDSELPLTIPFMMED